MKVSVEYTLIEMQGDTVDGIPSVEVICTRCDHAVQVWGQTISSVRKGCVILRSECPKKERNFYDAPPE